MLKVSISMRVMENLFLSLKIISKIPENGRIKRSKSGAISLETKRSGAGIRRFINGDSRKKTLDDINNIVDFAIEKSNDILNAKYYEDYNDNSIDNPVIKNKIQTEYQKQYELLEMIQYDLKNSVSGLLNLKTTYQTAATTVSRLDILITKIKNHLLENDKKITNYFHS